MSGSAFANLVRAGDTQTDAIDLGHGIRMARDVSNAYLVNTADGDLMVNTGFMNNAARKIGESHGKVAWAVRTIRDQYAGWLHYEDGTTALYGVPRSAVNADLAELAGGAGTLADWASVHVAAGRPLEALHLLDVALGAEPTNLAALKIKRVALDHLLVASGGGNLSETMWLKSELAALENQDTPAS